MGRDSRDERSRSRERGERRSSERRRSGSRERRHSPSGDSHERDLLKICWKPVKDDPYNFDAWTHLLQFVEQMDDSKAAREAYDEFFKRYPFCYGYWRKYADFERRHHHTERVIDVYERGISAISLSVDLWLSYLAFYKEHMSDKEHRDLKIRHLIERALTAAGLEFRSDKLWEEAISWETSCGHFLRASALFDRLLQTPTLLYSQHFDRYQNFINSYSPDQIISEDEYDQIFQIVQAQLKDRVTELYTVEEVMDDGPPEMISDSGERPLPRVEYRRKYNEEALKLFRIEILDRRRKKHLLNEQEVSRRWQYEEMIKRPYFHVKPLERTQLRNWRSYLDFEMENGNAERIIILFERALIACALYEEIWIRYARYIETNDDVEGARAVYKRAAEVHLPRKPNIHLAWSAFEEKNGEVEEAKGILNDFDRMHPGYALVQLRRIGIDRRQAIKQKTASESADFTAVTSRFERLIRDPRTPTKLASYYALKFARFHGKTRGDRKLAEKIVKDALTRDLTNTQLYVALIDLAYSSSHYSESAVVAAIDQALTSRDLTDVEKLRFSQRKLDFLEDLGTNIEHIQQHLEYHEKLARRVEAGGGGDGKRKQHESSSGNGPDMKRTRSDVTFTG